MAILTRIAKDCYSGSGTAAPSCPLWDNREEVDDSLHLDLGTLIRQRTEISNHLLFRTVLIELAELTSKVTGQTHEPAFEAPKPLKRKRRSRPARKTLAKYMVPEANLPAGPGPDLESDLEDGEIDKTEWQTQNHRKASISSGSNYVHSGVWSPTDGRSSNTGSSSGRPSKHGASCQTERLTVNRFLHVD